MSSVHANHALNQEVLQASKAFSQTAYAECHIHKLPFVSIVMAKGIVDLRTAFGRRRKQPSRTRNPSSAVPAISRRYSEPNIDLSSDDVFNSSGSSGSWHGRPVAEGQVPRGRRLRGSEQISFALAAATATTRRKRPPHSALHRTRGQQQWRCGPAATSCIRKTPFSDVLTVSVPLSRASSPRL